MTERQENPARAEADWPPAVIAGAFRTGVLGMRSLVRRGVRTICFDCNPANDGFRSAYGRARLCPNPDTDPEAWLAFMLDLGRTFDRRPALIASSDRFVSAIAAHRRTLDAHYLISPGVELQGLLSDKVTQYDLAARHGMPMPRTRLARDPDAVREFAREATFPCLIKPAHFREWQRLSPTHPLYDTKVAIVDTPDRLVDRYEQARAASPTVILQEIITGADTDKRVYLSVYDAGGRRVANAMLRELRCDPVGFGPATVTEPVVDEEVDEACNRFLTGIGYVGICEIEMKRDGRDGRPKLIEANPRLSGSGDAAPYAGVDLCWLHYLDLIGRPVVPVTPSVDAFRHIVLRADARAAVNYWKAGLTTWLDVVRSYRGPRAYFDLDRGDWRYSCETLAVAGLTMLRALSAGARGAR